MPSIPYHWFQLHMFSKVCISCAARISGSHTWRTSVWLRDFEVCWSRRFVLHRQYFWSDRTRLGWAWNRWQWIGESSHLPKPSNSILIKLEINELLQLTQVYFTNPMVCLCSLPENPTFFFWHKVRGSWGWHRNLIAGISWPKRIPKRCQIHIKLRGIAADQLEPLLEDAVKDPFLKTQVKSCSSSLAKMERCFHFSTKKVGRKNVEAWKSELPKPNFWGWVFSCSLLDPF